MTSLPARRRSDGPRGLRALRSLLRHAPWLLLAGGLAAAQPPEPLSLTEALRLAELRSTRLVASDQAIAGAAERSVSSAQLPDPVLRAGVDNLPVDGPDRFSLGRDFMTMRRIGLMQELTGGAKRALRRERGERSVAVERAMRRATLATLRRDVALAWLDRAYASRTSQLLESLNAEIRLQVLTVEAAIPAGRVGAVDARTAQAVLLQAEDQLAASRQQERAATRTLERWLGDHAFRPIAELPDTGQFPRGTAESAPSLVHHAEIAVAREAEALASIEVQLARRSRVPDWSVEVAYQQRGTGFADMMSFGISVPLPLFTHQRQDREIRASEAALAQARAAREDLEREHRAEILSLMEEWQGLGSRIARLDASLVPLAAERVALALAAYRGGSGTLSQTLEARRAEVEARLQVLALQRDRARVWARLRYVSTAEPRETAP